MKKHLMAFIAAIVITLSVASSILTVRAATSLDQLMNTYVGTTWNSSYYGTQCKGFANFIFYKLWDVRHIGAYGREKYYIPNPSGSYEVGRLNFNSMSKEGAKQLLLKGLPGDFIQVRRRNKSYGHSMILVNSNSQGITVFDCNSDGRNGVRKYFVTWQQFYNQNSAMSLYRANNNRGTTASTDSSPQGYIDEITGGNGQIKIRGWAFDPDDCSIPLDIHVYISNTKTVGKKAVACIRADKKRSDVTRVYPSAGDWHGFEQWIDLSETGTCQVYLYAINIGGGTNVELGSRSVNIQNKQSNNTANLSSVYYGDVNRDGVVDGDDASKVCQFEVGKITLTADEWKRADVNGDGKVNNLDASLILRYDVGLINKFPVES